MKEFIERAEQSEVNKTNQAKIEIFNTPVFVMTESSPAENPDPKNLDTKSSFLDMIIIILAIIADAANAIYSHEKK
jgi:hypothetical protein